MIGTFQCTHGLKVVWKSQTFDAGVRGFEVGVEFLGTHVEGVDLFVWQFYPACHFA